MAAFCVFSCGTAAKLDIDGKWTISSVAGVEVADSVAVPTIEFTKGSYHAEPGVNIVNGEYSVKGDVLTMGDGRRTMMAGPQAAMQLEDKIIEIMAEPLTVSLEGEVLSLSNAEGVVVLELRK